MTLLKAAAAFGVAVLLARLVVRPLFDLIARARNEEVFTAMALLVAWPVRRSASALFVPYFLWVTLAVALNFEIWRLNG